VRLHIEAHLPPERRTVALVRWLRAKPPRSKLGWYIFIGFIVLNETRGLYVVAEFLKAYNAAG
jgi:hypothetical protein